MPELPEVETVVRELRPALVGRRISRIRASRKALRRPWSRRWTQSLAGIRIEQIDRRGKWILIHLEQNLRLVLHLGMTGQLTVVPSKAPVSSHTHLIFDLDRGVRQLRFRDIRRFGCASLFASPQHVEDFFRQAKLGPEPFDLSTDYWQRQLSKTERTLKVVLLDQRVVAGVGNIYADESLFEARLHPARIASALSAAETARLAQAIQLMLQRAIEKRGSTIRDYVGGNGDKGGFQKEFQVYGRADEPCARCARPIQRIVLAGRSTHFCPNCQPLKNLTQRRKDAKTK